MKQMNKKKAIAFTALAVFAAVVLLNMQPQRKKEVDLEKKTKVFEVEKESKRMEEESEEIQATSEPTEGTEAILVDGGSSGQKKATAPQAAKSAAIGSGKQASASEQARAEKHSSDGAGQKGMSYGTSQSVGTPQPTPEIVEVKPVEKPVETPTPAPATPAPTPVPPQPTVVPTPEPVAPVAPTTPATTPVPQEPVQEATPAPSQEPALDYSDAQVPEEVTQGSCPVGLHWNGSYCTL